MGIPANRRATLALLLAAALAGGACSSAEVERKQREDKATYHYRLALGFFESKNIDLSIRELVNALSWDSGHADSRYLYGFILFGRKQYEEAAEHFRLALQRRPKFFEARNHLGVTYLEMERWTDAVRVLEPLLKEPLYTTPYLCYNNLGWAQLRLGDLRLAEKHLRMAVFINPKFCQGHRNLALLAVEQRDLRAAVSHIEEALRLCPQVAEFHLHHAEILTANNRPEEAEQAFGRCAKVAGDSQLGRRCRNRMTGPLEGDENASAP
jgi:Tfp pilus assembly protein PilF